MISPSNQFILRKACNLRYIDYRNIFFRNQNFAIFVYSIMHSNIWNLRSSKERLGIMQKTQAHKRHLINLMTAKSKLDTHQPQQSIHHRSFSPLSLTQKQTIMQNNHNLARKLILISKTQHSTKRELSLSRNLKTYSSLNRMSKQKEIQEENCKLFSRLITTPSTLKRSSWSKSSQQADKYKQNLHRSRYLQPDYSLEASKIIRSSPKFKCLLTAFSDRKNLQETVQPAKRLKKQRFF